MPYLDSRHAGRRSLVGRAAELERLVGQAQDGRGAASGGVVLVGGEAGVGKSRLIAELVRRSADALVISGAASTAAPRLTARSSAALRSHLRSHPDGAGGLRAARRRIWR